MIPETIDWGRIFCLRQIFPPWLAMRRATRPLSVEELQEQYSFAYYSTMCKAVTDVNNGTLANADATKDTAVAGVYADESGGKNVVLLKDNTEAERIKPSVDMTINLGGHVLSTNDYVGIQPSLGNITVDGRIFGSAIIIRNSTAARVMQIVGPCNTTVNGGTYSAHGEGTGSNNATTFLIAQNAELTILNAKIMATETSSNCRGIDIKAGAKATISNCDIQCLSKAKKAFGVFQLHIR